MEFNYYEILGVNKNASEEEIKAAFKSLAKKYHPDKHAGNTVYEEHFKKINSAYQTLSDPKKRQRYDLLLQYKQQRQTSRPNTTPRSQQTQQRPMYKKTIPQESNSAKIRYAIYTFLGFAAFVTGAIFFYHYMNKITAKDHLDQGILMEISNKNLDAIQQYTAAISYDEKLTEAFVRRADLRIKTMGDYKGALSDFSKALKNDKNSNLYFRRAKCYLKLKKYNEGLVDLNKAIVLNPKSDTLYYYKGEVYNYIQRRYANAIDEYNKAIIINNKFSEAILGRALSKQSLMRYKESLNDFNTLIQLNPNEGSYYYYRGYSKAFANQKDEACKDFIQAYSLGFSEAQDMIKEFCK